MKHPYEIDVEFVSEMINIQQFRNKKRSFCLNINNFHVVQMGRHVGETPQCATCHRIWQTRDTQGIRKLTILATGRYTKKKQF